MTGYPDCFNRDHHLAKRLTEMVQSHGIRTIVETGVHIGQTTEAFASLPVTVHGIELNTTYLGQAMTRLAGKNNVTLHHGTSWVVLASILPTLEPPLLLFLDCHWGHPTPTPHELRAIAASGIKPAVIVVHDVQVPGRPEFLFDSYPDFTYNWETIKPLMEAIYGADGYRHRFNDQPAGANRGALIVERW